MGDGRLGVVLVHGIRSGPRAWDPLRQLIGADAALGFVQPLTFSYATGLKRLHPLRVLPSIDTAADSLVEYLATEAGDFENLVLVSHSQGGLVVQRCLARMLGDGRGRELVRVRRVVMLACPNSGSELFLSLRRSVLGSGHPQESQLRPLSEQVTRTLRTVMRDVVNAPAVSERACPIPFSVYAGESDGVVTPASAQSVFPDAAALPGDHAGILKATAADHRTFTTLRRLLLAAGTPDRPPAPQPGAEALAGLPPRSRTFTGREQDVRALLALLAPGGERPVLVQAVAGMGGVGKTELALQTAERALLEPGWFPGGVLFTDLNGYDPDPARRVGAAEALDGFLRALATPADDIPPGVQARTALLRSTLAARTAHGRRTLVVIDNAGSEEQVLPLLPGDGTTPALVTSRNTLVLGARVLSLDILDAQASADLIRQALHEALGPGDTRTADDPAGTAALADLCGGLPLALRITAALLVDTPQRPVASLVEALRAGHTRLDHLSRTDQAVRGAFDLSYHHLTADQQQLFRLLPLNAGPDISTAAARQLMGHGDEAATERLLAALAAAHLVEPAPVWGRWRIHDLLRLHADEHGRRHAAEDDRDAAGARLLAYYEATAWAAASHMEIRADQPASDIFADRPEALAWLDTERPNLITAAAGAPHTQLAFALARYLRFRRHFQDWITLSTQTADRARRSGDRRDEARALNNLGYALQEVRRFDEAIAAHHAAADAFHELGDRGGEGGALNNLGITLQKVGRYPEAITALETDLEICRETGDRHGEAETLSNLGLALQEVGRQEEAISNHTTAAGIFRDLGDSDGEGVALGNLGLVLTEVRRYDEAITAYRTAIDIHRATGDRHSEGRALNNLGITLREVGRFAEALAAHEQDLEICRETGDGYGEGLALNNLGNALRGLHRYDEAVAAFTGAASIYRAHGDADGAASMLGLVEAVEHESARGGTP